MTRPQWLLACERMDRAIRGWKRALADYRRSPARRFAVYERTHSLFLAELGR